MKRMRTYGLGSILLVAGGLLTACGGGSDGGASAEERTPEQSAKVTRICPGPDATTQALKSFFEAGPGDVIEFCAGEFELSTGLVLSSTEGVTIRGAGIGETVLDFSESASKEGILVANARGITVEDLTVTDTPGDGIKVTDSRFITLRRLEATWSDADPSTPEYDPDTSNGTYGIYPVLSEDVIVEDSISRGSSDVGFYIGQSKRVIVRNNRAEFNVQGFEFENTRDSQMHDNVAENNAGGYLVVDLPGRAIFGANNRLFNNKAINNNIENFAPKGTIAAAVPRGTGMIVLASDQVEIFDNEIRNNDTLGIVTIAYPLIGRSQDPRFDYYAEAIHIHDNLLADNGTNPQLPVLELEEVLSDPGSLTSNPTLLPTLILAKNGGQMAHILWDGDTDTLNPDCEAPEGVPTDDRGEPQYGPDDEAPDCGTDDSGEPIRYNAFKFDEQGALIKPENWLCIHDNRFEDSGVVSTPRFANFKGTNPALADRDQSPHDCELPPVPETQVQSFEPSQGGAVDEPTPEEVGRLCSGGAPGTINFDAVTVDCPRLADYGLFADPDDPLGEPRGDGIPYRLNTPLFSDYALKRRVIFLPPGQPAVWRDHTDGPNAHLDFPVGTVIAKTFFFRNDGVDESVETRLLIKRDTPDGAFWEGLPYVWRTNPDTGERFAALTVEGATTQASWDYLDRNPDAQNANGERPRFTGSTDSYSIPHANQCVTCHLRDDLEAGSAPIGPKPRMLNRRFDYGGSLGEMNQLQFLCSQGHVVDCPSDLEQVERHAVWNEPGSSGELPGSDADVEARARAYLESNCAHCHNPKGSARNSRMHLDLWKSSEGEVTPRPVDRAYGICKPPVAAGRGTGDREFDIVPGDPDASIMEFRMANAGDSAIQMPPIARSVVHEEGLDLIVDWISRLPLDTTQDDNCSGPLGGLSLSSLRRHP